MSASLIVLIPVILLGIVGMLCFVGCILPTEGLPAVPFNSYSDGTVLSNSALAAFWPLNEQKVGDTEPDHAADIKSGSDGNYIDPAKVPPMTIYPWPEYNVGNAPGPDVLSAAADAGTPTAETGTIAFGQTGIVKGDVLPPANHPVIPACMVVNGCYVEVPFNDKFIPQGSFTVEAWVRVDWTKGDPHAWRFVLDAREFTTVSAGFGIYAKADDNQPGVYHWGAILGDGSDTFKFLDSTGPQITLKDAAAAAGTTFYLALTWNSSSQTLTLYVNDEEAPSKLTPVAYLPTTTGPLWIGAGAPYIVRRPQPAGVLGSPLFPFVGAIQDVAIYKDELTSDVVKRHFDNGIGFDP